ENTRIHLEQYLNRNRDLNVKTITWDRGMELAEHRELSQATGVEIFFADARSPWQRGTNENTNGLLRQYLPKKTNLASYTQSELEDIAAELKNRPRKTLGFQTPLEAQSQVLP
ncbi:MAG TPA: IS30 family transposase, partial [Beutenbergiaceae bacterium]|nr:IS30 family transposase [Beutenbergiaceae bacterium]